MNSDEASSFKFGKRTSLGITIDTHLFKKSVAETDIISLLKFALVPNRHGNLK